MIKKFICASIASILLCFSLTAQDTDSISTQKVKKNELSTDLLFLINALNYNNSDETEYFYLGYKRLLGKYNLRIGFYTIFGALESSTLDDVDDLKVKDSVIAINEYSERKNSMSLRFGIERSFQKKHLRTYFGTDILVGSEEYESHRKQYLFPQVSGNYFEDYSPISDFSDKEEVQLLNKYTSFQTGLSPFFGMDVVITKTFSLGFLFPINILYCLPTRIG